MTTLSIAIVSMAFALALCGILFSLVPVLPGPPLSALVLLVLEWGLQDSDQATNLGWAVAFSALVVGLGLTAIDLAAPVLAERLGSTSRAASIGAYLGMTLGFGLSAVVGIPLAVTGLSTFFLGTVLAAVMSIGLVFGMPFLGALVGELIAVGSVDKGNGTRVTELLRQGTASAITQWFCLVLTTTFKVVFAVAVLVGAAVLLVLQVS